ncbi:3D domain-containing protein [Niallia alba]|uniref:3D domain-containing protein n=1 Tax=Niallia alba TaxID=2729105 RepID=UPI00399FAE59
MKRKLIATGVIATLTVTQGYSIHTINTYKTELDKTVKINYNLEENVNTLNLNVAKLQDELKDEITTTKKLNEDLDSKNDKIKKQESQISKLEKKLKTAKEKEESPRKLNMTVTAYVDNCLGCTGVSASGVDLRGITEYNGYKIIAADKNVLPMFSIVKIKLNNTEFEAIVLDRGGAIKGQIIDYLVGSYDEAVRFGKQKATVTIIREGKG